jgi:hypothetical protein
MSLRSINCGIRGYFIDSQLNGFDAGWNLGVCADGSPKAQVLRLADGTNPRGVLCKDCARTVGDSQYYTGGKAPVIDLQLGFQEHPIILFKKS